jgi:hypothetical protein
LETLIEKLPFEKTRILPWLMTPYCSAHNPINHNPDTRFGKAQTCRLSFVGDRLKKYDCAI